MPTSVMAGTVRLLLVAGAGYWLSAQHAEAGDFYILVAVAAVGAQPWTAFAGQEAGLAVILRNLTGAGWTSLVLCLGAIISIFSVTLFGGGPGVYFDFARLIFHVPTGAGF